jgi:rhodanese-related sulfurtransferase
MANVTRVSPAEAQKLVDEQGYTYVDVRSEPEYSAGHPAGAHNVPLMNSGPAGMTPNPEFLDVITAAYPKDAKLVVGCAAGGRSLKAAEMMIAAGFTDVIDQRAGFKGARNAFGAVTEPGWEAVGLPVETTTAGASYVEIKKKAGK